MGELWIGDEVVLFDDDDAELVLAHRWYLCRSRNSTYARSYKVGYMHRLVLDAPRHLKVDHINGNGLDNRRSNLRLATTAQNACNRGPNPGNRFKGVRRLPSGRFYAQIHQRGVTHYLGSFDSEEEAAAAYDAAAAELFGEYASYNLGPPRWN